MKAPGRIDCDQKCVIPEGVTITEVPPPRHAWGDVFKCPNDDCGRTFLTRRDDPTPEADRAGEESR